jgi:hypothetical protein
MEVSTPRTVSTRHAGLTADGRLSRRRLIVLLAASAGTMAALSACGEEEKLTRDDYSFPGAEKDAQGNFKMQTFR